MCDWHVYNKLLLTYLRRWLCLQGICDVLCFIAALRYHYETQVRLFQLNLLCSFVMLKCCAHTAWTIKTCCFFNCASGLYWATFTTIAPVEIPVNILQFTYLMYRWCHNCFTLHVMKLRLLQSAVWHDCGGLLPGVHSVEAVIYRKWSIVHLSWFLLGNPLSVFTLQVENLFTFPQVFDQNFICHNSAYLILRSNTAKYNMMTCSAMPLWHHQAINKVNCRIFIPVFADTKKSL